MPLAPVFVSLRKGKGFKYDQVGVYMERRKFLGGISALVGAFIAPPAVAAWQPNPWNIRMLTKEIGVFTERGGTILFYVSADGIVIVDAQFPEQSRHLIAELRKRVSWPFNCLINTHHHADHTSGNIAYKGLVYQVIAHENSLQNQRRVASSQEQTTEQLYPDLVFADRMTRTVGKERISMQYFGRAHTNGDILVHFENANIVHVGDLVNNRRYPFIDRTAGASVRNWIRVLDKTISGYDAKTTFVFGHASEGYPVYGKAEDLRAMRDYFEKLVRFGEEARRSGKSREEFLQSKAIPGVTEWKGTGIERSLAAIYDELAEGDS